MASKKNPELDGQHQAILKSLLQQPENKTCADCRAASPRWASANIGVFLCIACSGLHRRLGTHISQVRSVNLDTWTPEQITRIQEMGNAKAAQLYEACAPPNMQRPQPGDNFGMERWIRDKYELKLYMREEDGGLGGVRGRATKSMSRSRRTQGAPSYGYQSEAYGDFGRHGGSDSLYDRPHSSRERFRQDSRSSYSGGGRFNGNRVFADRGVPRFGHGESPYQKAAVLKNLLDMGFDAYTAGKAVEMSDGNLDRAVEWVLANKPTSNAPDGRPKAQATETKSAPSKEVNLLDFGEDDAPATAVPTRPPAFADAQSSQSALLEASPKAKDPKQKDNDLSSTGLKDANASAAETSTSGTSAKSNSPGEADTKKPSSTPLLQTGSTSALTSSLAALYRKGPSTVPNVRPPSHVSPAIAPQSRPASLSVSSSPPQSIPVPSQKQESRTTAAPLSPFNISENGEAKLPQMQNTSLAPDRIPKKKEEEDPFANLMPIARKNYHNEPQVKTVNGTITGNAVDRDAQNTGTSSLEELLGGVKL